MARWTEGRQGWGVVVLLGWVTETGHLLGATTEVTEVALTTDPHVVEAEGGSIRTTKVGHPSVVGLVQVAQEGVGLAVLEGLMDPHPSAPQMDLVVLHLATLQVLSMLDNLCFQKPTVLSNIDKKTRSYKKLKIKLEIIKIIEYRLEIFEFFRRF